jgi:sulfane dehydrogenase subunit SoxC
LGRHHNGIPDLDPARHELMMHGTVKRPRAFSYEALLRYPMETHIRYLECPDNSGGYAGAQLQQATGGALDGLISSSEWTGVKLSPLLAEVGVEPGAKRVIAEGACSRNEPQRAS